MWTVAIKSWECTNRQQRWVNTSYERFQKAICSIRANGFFHSRIFAPFVPLSAAGLRKNIHLHPVSMDTCPGRMVSFYFSMTCKMGVDGYSQESGDLVMKKIFAVFLLVIGLLDASAQGVINLSNFNTAGLVTLDGNPVGPSWQVSFALPDGTLLGSSSSVLGAGFFSGGPHVMDGMVGEVDLRVAAWSSESFGGLVGYSAPFLVTLGTIDTPASIPSDFSGVHIFIPEPTTVSLAFIGIMVFGFHYRKHRILWS